MPTACSFYRGSAGNKYVEEERGRLALLLPHLSRALGVMTRLRASEFRVASSLAALDHLPIATVLMSGSGVALFANRAATALLAGTDIFVLDRSATRHGLGKLVAWLPSVDREIANALSASKRIDDVAHFSSTIRVPTRVPGSELLIQISRVCPGSAFGAEGQLPEVIAFLTDTQRPLEVAPELLCRFYGLTMAEARVAVAASAAGSIAELPDTLALGSNTVKTHRKQVYAKTGVRGRAELMRLILGLASVS